MCALFAQDLRHGLIIVTPLSGGTASRAVSRLAGTVPGAVTIVVLVPDLVFSPLLLSLGIAKCCVLISSPARLIRCAALSPPGAVGSFYALAVALGFVPIPAGVLLAVPATWLMGFQIRVNLIYMLTLNDHVSTNFNAFAKDSLVIFGGVA